MKNFWQKLKTELWREHPWPWDRVQRLDVQKRRLLSQIEQEEKIKKLQLEVEELKIQKAHLEAERQDPQKGSGWSYEGYLKNGVLL